MKDYPGLGLLLALLGLVLTTSLVLALTVGNDVTPGAVYSVAQMQAGLVDHPQAWVGRTVQVRGMAQPCPWWGGTARLWQCADDPFILVPDPADRAAEPLPLSQLAPDALPKVLRALPLLHALAVRFVARSRAVPEFTPARFRVQVQRLAAQVCGGRSPCYAAVLLAVAPMSP